MASDADDNSEGGGGGANLFTKNGKPMGFYMPPCEAKKDVVKLIEVALPPVFFFLRFFFWEGGLVGSIIVNR